MSSRDLLTPNEPETASAETEETSPARRMDTELRVIGAMLRMLDDLDDDDARERTVTYLSSRFHSRKSS